MGNEKVDLFGIDFDNLSMEEAINRINDLINFNKKSERYSTVVTPNVDHIVNINKDKNLYELYKRADLKLVDGMPILIMSKILKKPIKEKVSGSDLTPKLIELAQRMNYKVFIFGSKPGVAEKVVNIYKERYGTEFKIDCYSPPFGFEKNQKELSYSINVINSFQPDLLLVSLGSPKGEKFILDNLTELKVPISIQIGASIDFIAGTVKRAPVWMQNIGMEWFYRFIKEPKRMFRRYFINDSYFLKLIFKEVYSIKRKKKK